MAAPGIDRLRPLPDQKLEHAEDHCGLLRFFDLHGHKAHRRALCSFANGLGIRRIVRLSLMKGFA